MIKVLEENMKAAAKSLEFEKAAMLRDQVFELRSILKFLKYLLVCPFLVHPMVSQK